MADQIHFGTFSKANKGFISSSERDDLELFQEENPEMDKERYELSLAAGMQLSLFTENKYGIDIREDILLGGGIGFRVISVNAIEEKWKKILSYAAVSRIEGPFAPGKDLLCQVQQEVLALDKGMKEARKKYGDKACFLIW